ncbi:MAG: hypothetical protein ACRD8W_14900 [Nitrososphaeraceae archaeon]
MKKTQMAYIKVAAGMRISELFRFRDVCSPIEQKQLPGSAQPPNTASDICSTPDRCGVPFDSFWQEIIFWTRKHMFFLECIIVDTG